MAHWIWLENAFYFRTSVFGRWTIWKGEAWSWQVFEFKFKFLTIHFCQDFCADLSSRDWISYGYGIWIFKFSTVFLTSSWLDLTLTHWVWYTTQSFSHTNDRSDVTFAHFELISADFRYFFESVTTMVGANVLLAICLSPIPPNTSSWTQKNRPADHMWSLWG